MEQLKVFVSHASQDKLFADALVHALREAGADVWYDEHNLGAGHLLEEITKEITARKVFVVVLSKAAFASAWVRRECTWAFNLSVREPDRIVLPVVASSFDRSDFNALLFLEDFRRVEGPSDKPFPEAEAIERTMRLLGLTPTGRAATPKTPQPAESVDDLITHGKAKLAEKAYGEALLFFVRAAQLAPSNSRAWFNLGLTYSRQQSFQEALAAFERGLAIEPENASAWYCKGDILSNLERREEALAAFDQALTLDPTIVLAWHHRGNVLDALQHSEEALVSYDRALALDPTCVAAWTDKSFMLNDLERYNEALVACDRALVLDSKNANAWYCKGDILGKLNRFEEALAAYNRVLELDPDDAETWYCKGATLTKLKRHAEAFAAYDHAEALRR